MADETKKKTENQGPPKKVQSQQQKAEKGQHEKKESGDVPLL
jgi:hypothetical protein